MNNSVIFCLTTIRRQFLLSFQNGIPHRNYAKKETGSVSMLGLKKKKMGKMGPVLEKKVLPVETDPERLVNYVCGSNIYKTGEDIKLKSDNEYPDWLWNLRTGSPPPLEDLDPNSKEYWSRVRTLGIRRLNKLRKLKKF